MAFVVAIAGIIFPAISTISPGSPRGETFDVEFRFSWDGEDGGANV